MLEYQSKELQLVFIIVMHGSLKLSGLRPERFVEVRRLDLVVACVEFDVSPSGSVHKVGR